MSDIEARLQRSFDRDAIEKGIMRLANVVDGSGGYNPADNPEEEAATLALTDLLGNIDKRVVAEGIRLALSTLFNRWAMEGDV